MAAVRAARLAAASATGAPASCATGRAFRPPFGPGRLTLVRLGEAFARGGGGGCLDSNTCSEGAVGQAVTPPLNGSGSFAQFVDQSSPLSSARAIVS